MARQGSSRAAALSAALSIMSGVAATAANAADDGAAVDPGQTITIPGPKTPTLLPYRYMLAGVEAFDDDHALAPTAKQLRFRLHENGGEGADVMEGVTLAIVGRDATVQVPLAEDGGFVLPRDAAVDDDADVMLNKSKRRYNWHADVRSEQVPEGMRRLGDLRLECAVTTAIGKKLLSWGFRAQITALTLTTDWCTHKTFNFGGRSDSAISGATLVWGERRLALKVRGDGRSYSVPTGNKAFPDDALIEFTPK